MSQLAVYIPKPATFLQSFLHRGTALVAHPNRSGRGELTLYFEGNIYGAQNLETFREKVLCAAGRLVASYPTSAIVLASEEDLEAVGTFDDVARQVYLDPAKAPLIEIWEREDKGEKGP